MLKRFIFITLQTILFLTLYVLFCCPLLFCSQFYNIRQQTATIDCFMSELVLYKVKVPLTQLAEVVKTVKVGNITNKFRYQKTSMKSTFINIL